MGALTYDQYKTYLKFRFGQNDSFDSYYGVWTNAGYQFLTNRESAGSKRLSFPELQSSTTLSTTDGTAYVTVPSGCISVTEVFDETSNVRLDWMAFRDYMSKADRDTATSEDNPRYWTRNGTKLYLYPTPDAVYSLDVQYRKTPTALTTTSQVTEIGAEWDYIILELAVFIGRNWSNEPEKAEFAKKVAEEMIAGVVGIYDSEERARREKLRPEMSSIHKDTY
jgi:hypothetical protein